MNNAVHLGPAPRDTQTAVEHRGEIGAVVPSKVHGTVWRMAQDRAVPRPHHGAPPPPLPPPRRLVQTTQVWEVTEMRDDEGVMTREGRMTYEVWCRSFDLLH